METERVYSENRSERLRRRRQKKAPIVFGLLGILSVVIVVAALVVNYFHPNDKDEANGNPKPSATTTATVSTSPTVPVEPAGATWKMVPGNHDKNRWFGKGIPEIRDAKNQEEARAAIELWLDKVKREPILLAATTERFLKKKVRPSSLVDKNGWATEKAAMLTAELELAMATAKLEPDQADPNSTNSGATDKGTFNSRHRGISGDRRAVKVTLADGREAWVLWRCGQIVMIIIGRPPGPVGPTDQELCDTAVNKRSYQYQDKATRTPGYPDRGHAEEVVQNQDGQPKGGTEPTPYGTPGDGAGGETPEGEHREPDGKVIKAPPPTTDPVDSPSTDVDQTESPPKPTD